MTHTGIPMGMARAVPDSCLRGRDLAQGLPESPTNLSLG